MKLNNIKIRKELLELLEMESINSMQYYDNNNIEYNYKIIEFRKTKYYIINGYYKAALLITEKQIKEIKKRNGTGTNGTK